MPDPAFNLEALLVPTTLDEFFSVYWEKAPLLCAPHQPSRYHPLLAVCDIDFIVSSAFTLDKTAVEALGTAEVKKLFKGDSAAHVSELYDAYRQGCTIRVNRVQRNWKPIREMCRTLEQSFEFPVRANLYCTPPSASTSPAPLRHSRRPRTANLG